MLSILSTAQYCCRATNQFSNNIRLSLWNGFSVSAERRFISNANLKETTGEKIDDRCKIYDPTHPEKEPLNPRAPLHEQIESLKRVMNSLYHEPNID